MPEDPSEPASVTPSPTEGRSAGAGDDGAQIRTFLIADVRGYTLFTHERGDEAAAKLAAKFAALAREGVEGRGGSVLELRGDEALAVFASPRQALRDAPAIPLLVPEGIDLESRRVGNYQHNPAWGIILSQLWVT